MISHHLRQRIARLWNAIASDQIVQRVAILRKRPGRYDPNLLERLDAVVTGAGYVETKLVKVTDLAPGMVLEADIKTGGGTVLVSRGQEVTATLLARVRNFAAMPDGIAEPIAVNARPATAA